MKKILILGSGMVGGAMALDMAKRHHVTLADVDPSALDKVLSRAEDLKINTRHGSGEVTRPSAGGLEVQPLDVTDTNALQSALSPIDLVISAVPGFLGYRTLQTVIAAGRDIVDISFFPENALELNNLALKKHVTAIVDCGVAPGMGNLLLGYHNEQMTVTSFECLVGGLPKVRQWPFCYKAPFSPVDVIEEYVRPARFVENGHLVTREALSDPELIEFDGVGTLEAFNTDGLRTLIHTMPHIPNMKEKTLRYPGHIEYIRVLRSCGFFSGEKIRVDDGTEVAPLSLTSKLLFDQWRLGEEEEEFTVMRVVIEGIEGIVSEDESGLPSADSPTASGRIRGESGRMANEADHHKSHRKITYNLLDEYSPDTRTSSMARTTGYTATAAANMLLDGLCPEKGVMPLELIGKNESRFRYIMEYLAERGVKYKKTGSLAALV